jgi:glycosyltransferase involved in cell wall biosynthesis
MKQDRKNYKIIMLGPALDGLGGISRVAKIWKESSFFSGLNVRYFETVKDRPVNRLFFLIKGLVGYTLALIPECLFVHIHTSSYNSFWRKSLFIWIALLFRAKILLHIHPSHFYQFFSECRGLEKRFIYFLLKRIDLFVVLTEEMKKNIQKLLPDKKIIMLRNPVEVKKMKNAGNYNRLPDHLLYLGLYIRKKGVYELVDAIEILLRKGVSIQADFYGAKKIEKLRSYVKDKGLTEKIHINGWINDVDKIKVLYECTALILPSHSEGIPNVILEAMATKTPIISTLAGGLREILRDGENAIIAEVNNPKDLSEKILKCLENKELRERIAANAYRNVCIQYDVKVIKQDFVKIVEWLSH